MITRREMLERALAGAAVLALDARALLAQEGAPAYGGFLMGLQTYSLRNFDLDQTLKILNDLGLKYAQFYGGGKQMKITDSAAAIAAYREKLSAAGVQILSFGVESFTKDHEANRRKFDFAKAIGFKVYTANPAPESFESLDRLTREHDIKIAIHNHGPEDKRYGKLEQVLAAVDKWPEAIGACVDTGHVLRIGEDPVEWIRKLGPRVHDVHLKDASGRDVYNILGEGKLDVPGTLKALKEIEFDGLLALEYELNPKEPVEDIKKCLTAVREAAQKLQDK